jgi:hypothetical protein
MFLARSVAVAARGASRRLMSTGFDVKAEQAVFKSTPEYTFKKKGTDKALLSVSYGLVAIGGVLVLKGELLASSAAVPQRSKEGLNPGSLGAVALTRGSRPVSPTLFPRLQA